MSTNIQKLLEWEKTLEKELENNSTYRILQTVRAEIRMERRREIESRMGEDKRRFNISRDLVLTECENYFRFINNRPSVINNIVSHLKDKGLIFEESHSVIVTIAMLLRHSEKFTQNEQKEWFLINMERSDLQSNQITSSEGGQTPESSNKTNNEANEK